MPSLANLKVMSHVRAPGFSTGVASYVSVVGPTPDGMVHLQFYRDLVSLREEDLKPAANPENPSQMGMAVSATQENFDTLREDVAIISMPKAAFDVFAAGILATVKTNVG